MQWPRRKGHATPARTALAFVSRAVFLVLLLLGCTALLLFTIGAMLGELAIGDLGLRTRKAWP